MKETGSLRAWRSALLQEAVVLLSCSCPPLLSLGLRPCWLLLLCPAYHCRLSAQRIHGRSCKRTASYSCTCKAMYIMLNISRFEQCIQETLVLTLQKVLLVLEQDCSCFCMILSKDSLYTPQRCVRCSGGDPQKSHLSSDANAGEAAVDKT